MDWNRRYLDAHTPWDLGGPALPLVDLLADGRFPVHGGGRVLVPGAGRGHCALHLAAAGYQVEGIDIAPAAVEIATGLAEEHGLSGNVRFHVADLFAVPGRELPDFARAFDGIYELTCYCAIEPERRGEYADFVAACLAPGGVWAGLLFPLLEREGGPPYRIDEQELADLFTGRGLVFVESSVPARSAPARAGNERWAFYRRPHVDALHGA